MRIAALSALLLLTVACGDGFGEVQKMDTIAGYEEFLANNNPDRNTLLQATTRLEELYLEKAKADGTLESYDAYLEKFPEGRLREKAVGEREEFLFDWAKREDTTASWKQWLDEYPRGDKDRKATARMGIEVATYRDKIVLGATVFEEINMAEDPQGEKDGWAWRIDVTNNTDTAIRKLDITMVFLGADGGAVERKKWPVVTENWGIPMPDEFYGQLEVGQTRTWEWTEARKRLPKDYDPSKTTAKMSSIYFVK